MVQYSGDIRIFVNEQFLIMDCVLICDYDYNG